MFYDFFDFFIYFYFLIFFGRQNVTYLHYSNNVMTQHHLRSKSHETNMTTVKHIYIYTKII